MMRSACWYYLYKKAILESRAERALRRAERAQCAIAHRCGELRDAQLVSIEEWQNLRHAAHNLEILLGR